MIQLDPNLLSRLEALRLSVRHFRWGSHLGGRFLINRRGSSIEFADYLPYAPGDDIRSIDWKLYARLDKLFVKTYKEEVELTVDVVVDATGSMALPRLLKFTRSAELGLYLAYIGLAGHHRVRLSAITAGRLQASTQIQHRAQLRRLTEWANGLRPQGQARLPEWIIQASSQLRWRGGQLLLISDWMYPPAETFRALQLVQRRHAEMKVIQVLTPEEFDPARLIRSGAVVDSETGRTHELAYRAEELAQAVLDHNELLVRFCKRHGIAFAQHRLDQSLEQLLLRDLPALGFFQ